VGGTEGGVSACTIECRYAYCPKWLQQHRRLRKTFPAKGHAGASLEKIGLPAYLSAAALGIRFGFQIGDGKHPNTSAGCIHTWMSRS